MQKKIIALAVAGLVSGSAFAQSNVTVSGNLDMGYYSQSMGTSTIMDTKDFRGNNASTSTLTFAGTEDLGGGMKAGFQLGNDLAAGASNASAAIMAGESFLSLGGNFGTFKAGNVNTAGLQATLVAQPFGTAIGGGVSGAFGRLSGMGTNGTAAAGTATAGVIGEGEVATSTAGIAGARSVRMNNSLRYDSPSFSGLTVNVQLAMKNSDTNVVASGNTPGFRGLGLAYGNGPLNVAFVNEQYSVGDVAAPTGGISAAGTAAGHKIKHNILAANYAFGPATVYGGYTTSKDNQTEPANIRATSWNVALKYAVSGQLALMANILKVNDKTTGNQDRNLNALGADYSLSKRTVAYVRYETGDNDKSVATGKFTRTSIGTRHSF